MTDVWLFLGPRTFVWNTDILCDDPQFFFSQYFFKNKFSRDVWLKFLNFDFFTNKTVEWPKFALFYMSFWPVLDRELATGVTPVTTFFRQQEQQDRLHEEQNPRQMNRNM